MLPWHQPLLVSTQSAHLSGQGLKPVYCLLFPTVHYLSHFHYSLFSAWGETSVVGLGPESLLRRNSQCTGIVSWEFHRSGNSGPTPIVEVWPELTKVLQHFAGRRFSSWQHFLPHLMEYSSCLPEWFPDCWSVFHAKTAEYSLCMPERFPFHWSVFHSQTNSDCTCLYGGHILVAIKVSLLCPSCNCWKTNASDIIQSVSVYHKSLILLSQNVIYISISRLLWSSLYRIIGCQNVFLTNLQFTNGTYNGVASNPDAD